MTTTTKDTNIKTLNSYRDLLPNWNTYGAPPISLNAIEKAIRVLETLNVQPEIFPTGRNSIQFEYACGPDYIEFEIFENKIEYFQIVDSVETAGVVEEYMVNELVNFFTFKNPSGN
jgi:hypothetical protein